MVLQLGLALEGCGGRFWSPQFPKGANVEFCEPEPVIIAANTGVSPEEACQVFFYGDYHYCGDIAGGYIMCCPGEVS